MAINKMSKNISSRIFYLIAFVPIAICFYIGNSMMNKYEDMILILENIRYCLQ